MNSRGPVWRILKMNKTILLLILLGLPVFSQEMLTLPEVIRMALEKNPNIQAARNNAANAENRAQIGNAGLLPKLTLTAGASYTDGSESQIPGAESTFTTPSAQLQASYTLFDGFGNVYRFKSLQTGGALGRAEAQDQIESIVLQTAQGYYGSAAAYENLQIARSLVDISNERYQRALNRSEYGRARTIDVLSAEVDLNADSVTLAQAELQWNQQLRSLNLLLFRDVNTPVTVDTSVQIEPGLSSQPLLAKAMENNKAWESARLRSRQARYDYDITKTAHLPRLDLTASYGYGQTNPDFDLAFDDPVRTARVGASFSLNLFNGLQTHIQRQNARRIWENQALLAGQAQLTLERDVANGLQAFRTSLSVRDLARRSMHVAELNFQRTEELYQLGQVTTTQFREAQLNLIRARSQVSSAKYDAKLNELTLRRLAGDLVEWGASE